MPITLRCPKCRAQQEIPDEAAGQTVTCSACQAEFTADPAPPPRPAQRSGKRWLLLGLALVLLAGGGYTAFRFYPTASATPSDFNEPKELFSARFPNPPESKILVEADPLKLVWGETVHEATVGRTEYAVTVITGMNTGDQLYGLATRDTHINQAVVIALSNANGQQLLDQPATHEGHTARDVVFYSKVRGKLVAMRVIAGEECVLRLSVTGSGDKDRPAEFLAQASTFFDGVQLGKAFGGPITEEPLTVSATDLAAAYKADAQAADAKYKDRWLRVTGTVREMAPNKTDFLLDAGKSVVVAQRAPPARMTVRVRPKMDIVLTGKCRGLEQGDGARVVLDNVLVTRPAPAK